MNSMFRRARSPPIRLENPRHRCNPLVMTQEVLAMRGSRGGAIVNVGSIAGEKVIRRNGIYNASKSACTRLLGRHLIQGAGHWVQHGQAEAASPLLGGFFPKGGPRD